MQGLQKKRLESDVRLNILPKKSERFIVHLSPIVQIYEFCKFLGNISLQIHADGMSIHVPFVLAALVRPQRPRTN